MGVHIKNAKREWQTQNVARGALLLDEKCPGWAEKINFLKFCSSRTDPEKAGREVLENIFGTCEAGYGVLNIRCDWANYRQRMYFGFMVTHITDDNRTVKHTHDEEVHYRTCWQKEIEDRLYFDPYAYV